MSAGVLLRRAPALTLHGGESHHSHGNAGRAGSLSCLHPCVCTLERSEWLPAPLGQWRQTGKALGKVWRGEPCSSLLLQRCFGLEHCLLVALRCAQKLWPLHARILWCCTACSSSNPCFCCSQTHIFVASTARLRLKLLGIALKCLKVTALKT